jgi:hypothetical protein
VKQLNNFEEVKLNGESENMAFIGFSHKIKNPRYPKWASEGDFGFWNSIYKPHLINLPPSDGRSEMR